MRSLTLFALALATVVQLGAARATTTTAAMRRSTAAPNQIRRADDDHGADGDHDGDHDAEGDGGAEPDHDAEEVGPPSGATCPSDNTLDLRQLRQGLHDEVLHALSLEQADQVRRPHERAVRTRLRHGAGHHRCARPHRPDGCDRTGQLEQDDASERRQAVR